MQGLAISLSGSRDAVKPQRTSSLGVGRSTHSRSHHGGSWLLILFLLSGELTKLLPGSTGFSVTGPTLPLALAAGQTGHLQRELRSYCRR
jgi:hypothetical protein